MNNKDTINNMITQQLRTGNVLNETILELYKNLPRNEFVPAKYECNIRVASQSSVPCIECLVRVHQLAVSPKFLCYEIVECFNAYFTNITDCLDITLIFREVHEVAEAAMIEQLTTKTIQKYSARPSVIAMKQKC